MSILRYRLDYPISGVQGFMISNAKFFTGKTPILENFQEQPIKMTISDEYHGDIVGYFDGDPEDWITDMKKDILSGGLPYWKLIAVKFNRYNPTLCFGCEQSGSVQELYIPAKICTALTFEFRRRDNILRTYVMEHSMPDKHGYFTTLTEYIDHEQTRFFEFGIESMFETRRGICGKEYLIITEFC